MKDWLLYLGAGSSATLTKIYLGSLNKFVWYELILIGFFILLMAVIGAFIGLIAEVLFSSLILKIKGRWIGKKKPLTQSL